MTQSYSVRERLRGDRERTQLEENRIDMREIERRNLVLRAENRLYHRRLYKERGEVEEGERIMRAKEAEIMRQCQLEQEEKIAQHLLYSRNKEFKDLKLRQHLRENNLELRELESQLNLAYAKRSLVTQCAEKRAAQMEEKLHEKFVQRKLQELHDKDKKLEEEEQLQECQKKMELRKELQDQLIANEKARRRAYFEFLEEKRFIDEITAQILEEDAKVVREECLKKRKTKEEMEDHIKVQEEEKAKRKRQMEEEDKRLLGYVEQKQKEEENHRRKQLEKLSRQEETSFMLGTRLYEHELEKLQHAEMLSDLHVMQAQGASEASHRAELEARVRRRFQLRQESMEQSRLRYETLQREADMDRLWTQRTLEKFAEDDRLEQLTQQKRWQKQQEHRRAVQQMLEDRKVERAAEMMRLLKEHEREECEEEQRSMIVKEERLRMLREHAFNLLGYLPPGVIKPDDLPHLGNDLTEKLKELQVSPDCQPINNDPLPVLAGYNP